MRASITHERTRTPPGAADADHPRRRHGELPRKLGLWSAVAVVVGITIGSGIFRTPAASPTGCPVRCRSSRVWIAGGIVALCGALTLAEVAGAFPETGGIYVFIRRGVGRLPAFLFGWAELAIIRAAAVGAIATTFAEYFLRVLGFDPSVAPYDNWVHYVAAGAIAVIVDAQLRRRAMGLARPEPDDGREVLRPAVHHRRRAIAFGLPKTGGHFTPVDAAGQLLDRAVRARAGVGAVGVRRLGGPRVHLRRGEGSAATTFRAR